MAADAVAALHPLTEFGIRAAARQQKFACRRSTLRIEFPVSAKVRAEGISVYVTKREREREVYGSERCVSRSNIVIAPISADNCRR